MSIKDKLRNLLLQLTTVTINIDWTSTWAVGGVLCYWYFFISFKYLTEKISNDWGAPAEFRCVFISHCLKWCEDSHVYFRLGTETRFERSKERKRADCVGDYSLWTVVISSLNDQQSQTQSRSQRCHRFKSTKLFFKCRYVSHSSLMTAIMDAVLSCPVNLL